ncbi:hypothetical protein PVAP13_5NG229181 [Panicum virgatum]|uniref:Uncharacterized protein n=1 Tax=Panicum virgatum TaxID=38727 RepID=A0A8T0RWL7_PANVG|nr:hypothetical protein PVAP13_5NG229181 [Panicum virgatum]
MVNLRFTFAPPAHYCSSKYLRIHLLPDASFPLRPVPAPLRAPPRRRLLRLPRAPPRRRRLRLPRALPTTSPSSCARALSAPALPPPPAVASPSPIPPLSSSVLSSPQLPAPPSSSSLAPPPLLSLAPPRAELQRRSRTTAPAGAAPAGRLSSAPAERATVLLSLPSKAAHGHPPSLRGALPACANSAPSLPTAHSPAMAARPSPPPRCPATTRRRTARRVPSSLPTQIGFPHVK